MGYSQPHFQHPLGLWKTENRMEVLKGSKKDTEANLGVLVPNLTHTFPVWELSVIIADWAWNFTVSQDGEPRLVSWLNRGQMGRQFAALACSKRVCLFRKPQNRLPGNSNQKGPLKRKHTHTHTLTQIPLRVACRWRIVCRRLRLPTGYMLASKPK